MESASTDTPPATPSPAAAESGAIVADRYRLIRKLGEGAMGAVYLAEHVHMRKRFALKTLLPGAMASPEIVARFEREAIAAGNIGHPGVCAATDFGRLPHGGFFLVLEYAEGESLRAVVARGPLPPTRAVELTKQVLAALNAAHGKGVVHRDIKPENVMVTSGDVVKVLDFGIAKLDANSLGEAQGTNLTRMGAIYGTPAYMAPEQAMGKAIDHRVDLYAVGVMLHEMLTGRPPFDGDGIIILAKHVNDPPPPLDPAVAPPALQAFVARLLAKAPDERPEDAARALVELEAARAALAVLPSDVTAVGSHPTVLGSMPTHPTAIAATVVGAEASPSPPPVVVRTRGGALAKLDPLAKRLGVGAKHLALGMAALAGMFFILVLILVLRSPAAPDDADDEARRPRRKTPTASNQQPPPGDEANKAEQEKQEQGKQGGAAPASSGSGGKGGGGIKGIGRKIKSLF